MQASACRHFATQTISCDTLFVNILFTIIIWQTFSKHFKKCLPNVFYNEYQPFNMLRGPLQEVSHHDQFWLKDLGLSLFPTLTNNLYILVSSFKILQNVTENICFHCIPLTIMTMLQNVIKYYLIVLVQFTSTNNCWNIPPSLIYWPPITPSLDCHKQ